MKNEEVYEMLPQELKEYREEILAEGGMFNLLFKDFISMNIETVKGTKVITSAVYIDSEDDTKLEWKYKAKNFLIYIDGVLEETR